MLIIYPRKLIVALCVLSCLAFGTLQYDVPNWTHLAKAQAATNENQQQAPETKQALSWTEDEFAAMATGTSVTLDRDLTSASIKILWSDFRNWGKNRSDIYVNVTRETSAGIIPWSLLINDEQLGKTSILGGKHVPAFSLDFTKDKAFKDNLGTKLLQGDKISFTLKATPDNYYRPKERDDTFTATSIPQKDSNNYNADGYFVVKRTNSHPESNPVIHWTFDEQFTITPPTGQPLPGPLTATALGALFYAYMKKRKKA